MQNTEVPVSVEMPRGISFYLIDGIKRTWKIIPLLLLITYVISWKVALFLLFTVFVHELSHMMACRFYGIPTKGIFLTFYGGSVVFEKRPPWKKDWVIRIAGPVSGLLIVLVTWTLYVVFDSNLLLAVTVYVSLDILTNMAPIILGSDGMFVILAIMHSTLNEDEESLSRIGISLAVIAYLFVIVATLIILVLCWQQGGGEIVMHPKRFFCR